MRRIQRHLNKRIQRKNKSNDKEPEKTVSNESYGDGEPENDKNSTEASDNEEEKTHSKNSNGDATLKQDTKKTAGVGKELEKIVKNKSNGDGTSKDKSAVFGMNYKKQLQMKLIMKVHFNRMQRTRLGLLERNLKNLLRKKVREL